MLSITRQSVGLAQTQSAVLSRGFVVSAVSSKKKGEYRLISFLAPYRAGDGDARPAPMPSRGHLLGSTREAPRAYLHDCHACCRAYN